jgi:predicted ribosome quality control (RQC) complex YloA/Tae2 family protein
VVSLIQYVFLAVSFKSFGKSFSLSALTSNPLSAVILKAQSLDYTSLFLSVNELAKACVPGKVENVIQENEYNIFIGLKTADSENLWLQFCWHPSAARIGLGYAPPKGETTPYSFSATLKAILRGYSVTSIKIPSPFDRIAEVEFSERLSDETPKWKLIVEVMGSRSNAILVSYGDNVIQACAYQVSSTTTVRPLQTGGIYQSPPSGGGKISPIGLPVEKIKKKYYDKEIEPVENTEENQYEIFAAGIKGMDSSIEKSLVTLYRGMSPNIARRILHASKVENNMMSKSLDGIQIKKIFSVFLSWASIFDSKGDIDSDTSLNGLTSIVLEPNTYEYLDSKDKKLNEYCPIDFIEYKEESNSIESNSYGGDDSNVNINRRKEADRLEVSQFLLNFYSLYERKSAFKLIHQKCERKIDVRMKKADKIMKDFEIQEKDAKGEKCDDLKALGDLITSFTHSYKDKSQSLQCYDFITGEPKVVAIPIGTTPSEYAKKLYMKAKKLKRSLKVLENLVKKTRLHIDYLLEIDTAISGFADYMSYQDITTLQEIDEELDDLDEFTIVQLGD